MPSARSHRMVETPDTPATFVWSPMQLAILDWFAEGEGNLIVDALAGTSKSTTIRGGVARAPEDSILVAAFNKRIQAEMDERIDSAKVEVRTWHSVGYRAIRQQLEGDWCKGAREKGVKPWDRAKQLADMVTKGAPYGSNRLVQELVSLGRELRPVATTVDDLQGLAVDFGVLPLPGTGLSEYALATMTLEAMHIAATREPVETGIDFSDQIFLPLRQGLLQPTYDLVVVDEYQDMTAAQLSMARAVCKPWGRIALFGDRHQAIYGFRGATSQSVGCFADTLHATVLPLHRTYRCPRSVVALAQQYVPAFEAESSAPDGLVDTVRNLTDIVQQAKAGDFILSRTNAPLASIAMALLRANKRTKIQGRKIGQGLVSIIRQLARGDAAHSVAALLSKLVAWEEKQCDRLKAMKRDDGCDLVRDQADTIRTLAVDAESVPGLTSRIEYLFEDDAEGAVICSTVHKAKGLEADRVFVLTPTFFLRVPCECGHRHRGGAPSCVRCSCAQYRPDAAYQQEEANLWYVAITRTKRHLTLYEEPAS